MSDLLDELFEAATLRRFLPGEALFHTGDPVARVWRVVEGAVVLRRVTPQGTELILQTARPGDLLAEASVYSETYHCDAIAAEASAVATVPRAELRRRLRTRADLAERWARRLSQAVQEARMRAEIRSLRTVAERLDAWRAVYGSLPPRGRWQDLAAELGVSREALYRELSRRRSAAGRPPGAP